MLGNPFFWLALALFAIVVTIVWREISNLHHVRWCANKGKDGGVVIQFEGHLFPLRVDLTPTEARKLAHRIVALTGIKDFDEHITERVIEHVNARMKAGR